MLKFSKMLATVSFIFVIGIGGICGYLAADSSDYLYLITNNNVNRTEQDEETIHKLKKIYSANSDNSSSTSDNTGSGVNLMLIAKMNDGYAKEMLTLYKDLQEGKITENDQTFVEVSTLLGMQTNETGTYDGTLPKTYLPYVNKKVVWNTEYKSLSSSQMTIRGFGDKEWEALGGGLCSWLSEGVDSASDRTPWCMQGSMITLAKSTINSESNAGRKKAEQHYIPDNIASINRRLNNFIKTYKVDSTTLSEEASSILAANIHNRGEGGVLMCSFGLSYNPYGGTSSTKAAKVLKNNNYNLGVGLNNVTSLLSDYMANSNANLSKLTSSEYGRIIFSAIAAHSNNWFFSQDAYNYLNGKKSKFTEVWNTLYPNENITSEKAMEIVKQKVSDLSVAIKQISGENLTSTQTKNIYNTANDYSDCSYAHGKGWGVIYCVVNSKIKYADNKNHTLVSAYDMVGGGYLVSACMIGKYVYAKMLKVSGVGIDPTNPKTYLNDLTSNNQDTYIPGGNKTSSPIASSDTKVSAWLSQIGLSYSNLVSKQVSLFEGIYGRLGTPYKSCRHGKTCDGYCYDSTNPTHLDAATFIWRSFYDADMQINATSCEDLLNDSNFKRIAWKDRKPGDVLVTLNEEKSHAMFYIKDKGDVLTVAEAKSGKESKVTSLTRGTTIYTSATGTKKSIHYGANGGKKYVLLRYTKMFD